VFFRFEKFLRISTIQLSSTEKKLNFCGIDNISALKRERKEKQTNHNKLLHLTHAYVHWLADVHSGGSTPAFAFVVSRQRTRPLTANAHSLGR